MQVEQKPHKERDAELGSPLEGLSIDVKRGIKGFPQLFMKSWKGGITVQNQTWLWSDNRDPIVGSRTPGNSQVRNTMDSTLHSAEG